METTLFDLLKLIREGTIPQRFIFEDELFKLDISGKSYNSKYRKFSDIKICQLDDKVEILDIERKNEVWRKK
mgnify:CR=1 FL=1